MPKFKPNRKLILETARLQKTNNESLYDPTIAYTNKKCENILKHNGFVLCNSIIAKLYGIDTAMYLGELCREHDYWKNKLGSKFNGIFFSSQKNISKFCPLSKNQATKAKQILEDAGIIYTTRKGAAGGCNAFLIDMRMLNEIVQRNADLLNMPMTEDIEDAMEEEYGI